MSEANKDALAEVVDLLVDLGMPRAHADPLSRAMHLGESVIDLVDRRYQERAARPEVWERFHRVMLRTTPRRRFIARWHHRRMARRYHAMVEAGTAIGGAK